MFIETNTGKLINLYLLQDMRKGFENDKFKIKFVHINGEIYEEVYNSEAEMTLAYESYKTKLLGE